MKNKKILFLCPYPFDVQAGQRFKFEQHYSNFKKNNFDIEVNSFFSIKLWNVLYKRNFLFLKIFETIKSYFRRYFILKDISKYDVVYVFLWGTPFFDVLFEKILIRFSKKIIFDIEDNVLLNTKNNINPIASLLKSSNSTLYLIKNSTYIITSSIDLQDKCNKISKKNNSFYIPPTLPLERYYRGIKYINKKTITIGWTGTFSSIKYLSIIENAMIKISSNYNVIFKVISNDKYINKNINITNLKWNKKTEIEDLLTFDIGLYPLLNEEWVSGKSGLKALQYMALGIPTIASNIGNINNIIENNIDGILVNNNDDEWFSAIMSLIEDFKLRESLGKKSLIKIKKNYTNQHIKSNYLRLLKS